MTFNNDWNEVKLGEVAKFRNGKRIGEEDRNESGRYSVFGSNGIIAKTDKILTDNETIIIGRVGAYCGSVLYNNGPAWITDNAIACTVKNNNTKFIYYLLKTIPIRKMAGGSAQPLINQSTLKNISLRVPCLEKQNLIVEILSSLENKIKINSHMNHTLEEIAQSIYKKWFIKFEPFEDEEFVDSKLGGVPQGWEIRSLYSLADYINGGSFPQRVLNDTKDGLPVIKISELNNGGVSRTTKYYNEDYTNKYELENGDILFAWSASLGIYLWSKGKALLNQHIYNVKPISVVSKELMYFMLKEVIDEFIRIAASRATTMGHITKGHLKEKLIAVPPNKILNKIDNLLKPLFHRILENEMENDTLKKLRDSLLPRLISGEISVVT